MSERTVVVTSTGIQYDSARARPDLLEPKREGEHVWVVTVVYLTSAEEIEKLEAHQSHLDAESIAMVGTGCFVCEQPYSKRLTFRKCPGEPR